MSFGPVFHFDFSQGDAFMKSLGRLFVSSALFAHDILSSIFSPAEMRAISKDGCDWYIKAMVQEIYVLSFGPVPVCTGLCLR